MPTTLHKLNGSPDWQVIVTGRPSIHVRHNLVEFKAWWLTRKNSSNKGRPVWVGAWFAYTNALQLCDGIIATDKTELLLLAPSADLMQCEITRE
jgi:hypothetical protein